MAFSTGRWPGQGRVAFITGGHALFTVELLHGMQERTDLMRNASGVLSLELADKGKWDKNGQRLIPWQVWGAKLPMSQAVHEAVLVMWVVLNQWAIGEMIEGERGKPTRKRRHKAQDSGEPRPFPGLAQKPVCDECEKEGQGEVCEVAAPAKMVSRRGRPAAVDTSRQFCPNEKCCYYGRVGWGNIVANGHPGGGCGDNSTARRVDASFWRRVGRSSLGGDKQCG
jgi:hypothetical protein